MWRRSQRQKTINNLIKITNLLERAANQTESIIIKAGEHGECSANLIIDLWGTLKRVIGIIGQVHPIAEIVLRNMTDAEFDNLLAEIQKVYPDISP